MRKLLKTLECKKYIQYSEKLQGKLCFLVQAQSYSKILNGKKNTFASVKVITVKFLV